MFLDFIRQWLAPPEIGGGEFRAQRAIVLNQILLFSLLANMLAIIGGFIGNRTPAIPFEIGIACFVVLMLIRWEFKKGKLIAAEVMLTVFLYLFITVATFSFGTVRTPLTSFYLFWVTMVGLLFGLSGVLIATGLSSLAIVGLIWGENAKILPKPDFSVGFLQWFLFTIVIGVTASLVYYIHLKTKTALARTEESEARFRTIIFQNKAIILQIDPLNGYILDANEAACQFYGWTHAELCAKKIADLNTLDAEQVAKECTAAANALSNYFIFNHKLKNGDIREVEVHSTPVVTQRKTILVSIIHDITEKRVAEKSLATQNANLKALLDTVTDGVQILDMQGNLLECSPSFAAMLGYTHEEMVGLNVRDWNVGLSQNQVHEILSETSNTPKIFENTHRRKDGGFNQVTILAKKVEIDGKDCIYASARDITQQRLDRAQLKLLATCMAHTNDVVMITEAEPIGLPGPRIVYVNEAFEKMTGYAREEAIGNTPRMLQGPKSDSVVKHQIWDALLNWKPVRVEMLNYAKGGREFWVELDITPIADDNGIYTHWISIQRDITERKTTGDQVRKLSLAVEQSLESVVVTDLEGKIEYVNEAFVKHSGYAREEVIGQNPRILHSGLTPSETYQSLWESLLQGQSWQGEFINQRKDGSHYTELTVIHPIHDETGRITHYVASKEDVTEQKAAAARTHHLAFYDQLTELPNRQLLLDRLHLTLKTGARNKGHGVILFIDLDNFKTLNDTLGHGAGDALLKQVASRLLASVREGDTVARFGGDEFVIMLENLSQNILEAAAIAEEIAKKVVKSFDIEFAINNYVARSTPSIGITLFSREQENSVDEIMKQADLAMYAAKADGGNTHRFFDRGMQTMVNARAVIEWDLRVALNQDLFRLYYQPQLNIKGQIIGAEALLRIQHPTRGLIAPGEFINVAEETGLILPIGKWVLETACAQLAKWAANPKMARLSLAVNVSARQFRDQGFVEQVLSILYKSGANSYLLKLEPTESVLLENVEETIDRITTLRVGGVHFALDDFGTGYSSLTYLKKLPLDQLKIDQSFVRDIPKDREACSIVRAIINLSNSLGLGVIAEGVETEEQRQFLLENGCEFFQGYLFSRPVSIEEFDRYVLNHSLKKVEA